MGVVGQGAVFTIANGATVSDAMDLGDQTLVGIITPSALTGTAISFQASNDDDGTYVAVKGSDGVAISIVCAASGYYVIQPAILSGIRFLKLVSNGAEGAARTIRVMTRACA